MFSFGTVGKEQFSQHGVVSLSSLALTLAPHFVNNDYVTAEISYSTVHVQSITRCFLGHKLLLFHEYM